VTDRALLLHRGNILAMGSTREVLSPANLTALYGVKMELIEHPAGGPPFCRPAA
jgi:iron complex transport system ATP-binding protein